MKNQIAILVAIVIGLIAAVLIYGFISGSTPGGGDGGGEVVIIVAGKNLKPGRALRPGDWDTAAIPRSIYNRAGHVLIRKEQIGAYDGQILTRQYREGMYLSPLTFKSKGSPEDFEVEPGNRAVTIDVDDISGVAGLIRPKDRVDVVIVQRLSRAISRRRPTGGGPQPPAQKGERLQLTVFRNVLVLATGRQTTTLDIGSVRRGGYETITFELPDEKALVLSSVQKFARVTLLLRSKNELPGEDIEVEVDSADLLEALKVLGARNGEAPPGRAD